MKYLYQLENSRGRKANLFSFASEGVGVELGERGKIFNLRDYNTNFQEALNCAVRILGGNPDNCKSITIKNYHGKK